MKVLLSKITISIVTVSFLLLASASLAIAQNAAKCEVTITAPQPGDKVGKSGRVRGIAKIPNGTYLWVLAHMKDLVAEWWPQGGRPAVIEPDGGWVIIAGYGVADDVNQQFEVAAVVVDANTNTRLRERVEISKKTKEYTPVEFPDTVAGCVPVKVTMNKTSH